MSDNLLLGIDEIELTNKEDIPQLLHDKGILSGLEDGTNSNSSSDR